VGHVGCVEEMKICILNIEHLFSLQLFTDCHYSAGHSIPRSSCPASVYIYLPSIYLISSYDIVLFTSINCFMSSCQASVYVYLFSVYLISSITLSYLLSTLHLLIGLLFISIDLFPVYLIPSITLSYYLFLIILSGFCLYLSVFCLSDFV
jgi:hypothetical protein